MSSYMVKLEKIKCPTCGKPETWQLANTFRPFCSERCKLIDLGDWASEKRRIEGEPTSLENSPEEGNNPDEEP